MEFTDPRHLQRQSPTAPSSWPRPNQLDPNANAPTPTKYYAVPRSHGLTPLQVSSMVDKQHRKDQSQPSIRDVPAQTKPSHGHLPSVPDSHANEPDTKSYIPGSSNHALQDYQYQLLLIEVENKKRQKRELEGAKPWKMHRNPNEPHPNSYFVSSWHAPLQAAQTNLLIEQADKKRLQGETGRASLSYHEGPRPEGLREIFLLRIVSSHTPGDIQTELCAFDFANCPQYVALSYVWGTDLPNHIIEVNGQPFNVRWNLFSALKQMHHDVGTSTYLWIDAICIDQSNMSEKSHVVRHMGAIFHQAQSVYAWLGEALPSSPPHSGNDVIKQLEFLGTLFWRNAPQPGEVREESIMRQVFVQCWPSMRYIFEQEAECGGFLTLAYDALCQREYWKRVWVLQEVHLANELFFHIADSKISLKSLSGAFALLQAFRKLLSGVWSNHSSSIARFMTETNPFPQMHRLVLYSTLYPSEFVSLQLTMTNFCITDMEEGSRATDPRDMIYGLIGFASEKEKEYILPRYDLDVCRTYQAATQAFLSHGWTDLLAWAQGCNKAIPGLPSWVPDYSATIHETMCSKSQAKSWLPEFKTSGDTTLYLREVSWSSTAICLAGLTVDKVHMVGTASACPNGSSDETAKGITFVTAGHLLEFLREAKFLHLMAEQQARSSPTVRATTTADSAWRVPIADQIIMQGDITRCKSNMAEEYESVLETLEKNVLSPLPDNVRPYIDGMMAHKDRLVFVTEGGFLGLGPPGMKLGDVVVVLRGFQAPYVLRPAPNLTFGLVGEAYVDGIMDGELMSRGYEMKVFSLV